MSIRLVWVCKKDSGVFGCELDTTARQDKLLPISGQKKETSSLELVSWGGQCPLIGDKIVIYGFFHKRKYIASRLGSRISCISRRNTQFLKLLSLVAPPVNHGDDPHSKIVIVDPKIHQMVFHDHLVYSLGVPWLVVDQGDSGRH